MNSKQVKEYLKINHDILDKLHKSGKIRADRDKGGNWNYNENDVLKLAMGSESVYKKYTMLDDGMDFRTIATKMTDAGFPMNHATARNVYITALKHLVSNILEEIGENSLTDEQIVECFVKNYQNQEALGDLLYKVYQVVNERNE